MTTENPNKIDLSSYEVESDDGRDRVINLLDSVKINMNNFLSKEEQAYYIDEINYMLTGQRHSKAEVLHDIEAGSADIDDIGGY